MISFDEALKMISENTTVLEAETVSVHKALRHTLTQNTEANQPFLPPYQWTGM